MGGEREKSRTPKEDRKTKDQTKKTEKTDKAAPKRTQEEKKPIEGKKLDFKEEEIKDADADSAQQHTHWISSRQTKRNQQRKQDSRSQMRRAREVRSQQGQLQAQKAQTILQRMARPTWNCPHNAWKEWRSAHQSVEMVQRHPSEYHLRRSKDTEKLIPFQQHQTSLKMQQWKVRKKQMNNSTRWKICRKPSKEYKGNKNRSTTKQTKSCRSSRRPSKKWTMMWNPMPGSMPICYTQNSKQTPGKQAWASPSKDSQRSPQNMIAEHSQNGYSKQQAPMTDPLTSAFSTQEENWAISSTSGSHQDIFATRFSVVHRELRTQEEEALLVVSV